MRRIALFFTAAAATLAILAPPALAQDDPPEPTLESNLAGAGFGEQVIVSGTNWPENSIVQVEICGNLALNGTSDCDQTTAYQSGVSTRGTFGAIFLLGNPPVPCPCVFRATSLTSSLVKTLEFEVRGAAVGETAQVPLPDRRLDVIDARIEGSGPWLALLGARPDRTLHFTVVNTGFVAVNNPSIVLGVGKGANPEGFVAPPSIDRLEPGESITLEVDLELPVFAIGTYAVQGSIPGFDTPVEFRAESSHVPWLLLLLPVLALVVLGVLALRNRRRERSIDDSEIYSALPPPPAAAATAEPESMENLAVIDLRDDEPIDVDAEWDEPAPAEARQTAEADGAELEGIISEELGAVFDEGFRERDESISDDDFYDLVVGLAGAATGRVAERAGLGTDETDDLDGQMVEAVLGAFGLEPRESV